MGSHLGDIRTLSRELRERFLLTVAANRYYIHPIVREVDGPRLRGDEMAWRKAHRHAGMWYARLLGASDRIHVDDTRLAHHLAGARYHLIEAQLSDELREAMRAVQNYLEQNYGWTARNPSSEVERDAQISLLDVYLTEPGPVGIEFHLAKLLKARAAPGDLLKARTHAQRSTVGQDQHNPWALWINSSMNWKVRRRLSSRGASQPNMLLPTRVYFLSINLLERSWVIWSV